MRAQRRAGGALKVCVFGAGAIGGYLGVQLARAGVDVSLVARGRAPCRDAGKWAAVADRWRGANCSSALHRRPAELGPRTASSSRSRRTRSPTRSSRCCRCSAPTPRRYREQRFARTGISTAQRACLPMRTLDSVDPGRQAVHGCSGRERAIGCVVFPAAEVVAPGVIRHEHGRKFPIGEPDGQRHAAHRAPA